MDNIFLKYYTELDEAYHGDTVFFSNNTDRLHNAAIMLLMLRKSNSISMFCGNMSVFRDQFYSMIDKDLKTTDNHVNGNDIKNDVATAFKNFVEKENSSLNIIIEEYCEGLFDDLIFDRELLKHDSVHLYSVPDYIKNKNEIGHFSFTTDKRIVRLETHAEKHEAICRIDPFGTDTLTSKSFKTLRDISCPIRI